jgi:hypothetical protein
MAEIKQPVHLMVFVTPPDVLPASRGARSQVCMEHPMICEMVERRISWTIRRIWRFQRAPYRD